MYSCPLHQWNSYESPCPSCHRTVTVSTTEITTGPVQLVVPESPTTADASVLDDRNKFRVLKHGWIYVDVNRLSEGLYQELQPVLYPKDYAKEKIILNYEDTKEYTRTTDEVIARVKENLDKCKMVDVYLAQYSTQSLPDPWKSVEKDGYPEHNIGLLVCIPGEDYHITSGMWDISKKWVLLDEYREPECPVTHYMLLPKLPKEFEKDVSENDAVMEHLAKLLKMGKIKKPDQSPSSIEESGLKEGEVRRKIICYCGSLRKALDAFKKVEYESVMNGEIALLPCCMFVDIEREYGAGSDYKIKADDLHKRKIDICDEVFVLNVGGYIGESTRSEIEYAEKIGKPVKYLEP